MKWIDYREALGVGFNDFEKTSLLVGKIAAFFDTLSAQGCNNETEICLAYFSEVGVLNQENNYYFFRVRDNVISQTDTRGLISHMVAFSISAKKAKDSALSIRTTKSLKAFLDDLNICYELVEDNDGCFIFPRGAKELDDANVSEPFEWLRKYPSSRRAMALALRSYSNSEEPSVVADLFRKALETFCKEFLGNNKALEKQKSELGSYLKEKGVPAELSGSFETLIQMYVRYMNEYAKHNDKTSRRYLEFIMYQTGNIIRFVISLCENEVN